MKQSPISIAVMMAVLSNVADVHGSTIAPQITVEDIRVGLSPEKTRLVFDLSGPIDYRLSMMQNPTRVLVELAHSESRFDPATVHLSGTPIQSIYTQDEAPDALRFVIEVEPGTDAHAFTLKPFADRADRLVLDLYSANAIPAQMKQTDSHQTATLAEAGKAAKRNPPPPVTSSGVAAPREYNGEWSGYLSFDSRLFFESPKYPDQKDQDFSVAFKPEYYVDWSDGEQQFGFSPFFRYDTADDQRTHADVRELYWQMEHDRLITKLGVDVVFWGVAESQHLVDIINQTDLVENIDGEEKLGQPMINLDYLSDWGSVQFYVLPYFRERTFPGKHGRLRTEPAVDTRNPQYESGSKEKHVDFALRWSHNVGDWDLGLAHFTGTTREPYLQPDVSDGRLKLYPFYFQIDQTSVDAQATKGAWLWKLEAIYNENNLQDYYAYVGGFEHTNFGVADSPVDLGVLLEYHYDERGDEATNGLQSDLYLGLRVTGNDLASSMALVGFIYDTDTHSVFGNIEASRRLNENWTLGLELRFTSNTSEEENLYYIESDDYLGFELRRYF
ncbi:MAG: AMIN domain-containing protein [Halioglobus sp.]